MGTPGVPFPYNEEDIRDAIVKHEGVMAHAALELNCSTNTLYRHFNKYPSLKPILDERRWGRKEEDLDAAENVLRYAMSECKEKDLTNALKASFFFLNNKGKERGYSPLPEQENKNHKEAMAAIQEMSQKLSSSSQDSSLNKEPPKDQC